MSISIILVAVLALLSQCQGLSSSTTLTSSDKSRLQQILQPGWDLKDLSLVMYAASGYKHLGLQIPDSKAACAYVTGFTSGSPATETIFQAVSAAEYLGCPIAATPQMKQTLQSSLSESSSLQEVYHAVLALRKLNVKPDTAKVLPLVQAALKKEDSILHLGYAFHIASVLSGDVTSIYERIEDAIVQADEVDGKMLQFEGGLSITALLVDGAYKLSEAIKKPVPIKPEQAVKFANYLLSRKSVPMAKGVHYLLHALTMFITNNYHIPVSISLSSSVAVSADQPKIQVSVTDLLGNSIGAGIKVVAETVTKEDDKSVLSSNVNLVAVKEPKNVFEFDVMKNKPGRGFYKVSITATGNDKRLVGNVGAIFRFKVLTSISVEKIEFGTVDADQSAAPALKKIAYGTKLPGFLEADRHQKVLLRFALKDTATGKNALVHQAFVRISHATSGREIIYVAEPDVNDVYKFDMSVSQSTAEFGSISGKYSVELIVGDSTISNPLKWALADLSLTFPAKTSEAESKEDLTYKAKPEIIHQFQQAEKRPPTIFSSLFTGLCIAPMVVLLILWGRLGVNISNFPFSLTAIGFHVGMGLIFGLYLCFWLQLNMFTTLRYLAIIGGFTFYCGNSMLSKIAASRKESSK